MNNNILVLVLIIGLGLFFIFGDFSSILPVPPGPNPPVPTPLDPDIEKIAQDLKNYIQPGEDADKISSCLKAAANLFRMDNNRTNKFYGDVESQKEAIKNIGSITFGVGFDMDQSYPGLSKFLASQFKTVQTKDDVINNLDKLSLAITKM